MADLVAAMEWTTTVVLSYFQSRGVLSKSEIDLVDSKVINADKATTLFHILKSKDSGWSLLLSYLESNNQSSLSEKLLEDAGDMTVDRETKPKLMPKPRLNLKRSALEEFSLRLAKYYQLNYADVPTMGQSAKHVKDVWVPLQIDGRQEDHLPDDRIDHIELLNRLKSTRGRNVALIKGDPGMGKTTLSKKIAYDWAVNFGTSNAQQFTLVLAVPLRYAGKSNRFISLAIEYFSPILEMEANIIPELMCEINQMGSQLLVILDGLDEYSNYSASPFKVVFGRPFQIDLVCSMEPPPMITFKLLVTSRPYACERINDEFWPLRLVILSLDANHLSNFVNLYCQTPEGTAKVTEYISVNAELVIQVPLILTFICYLADSVEEIPTNMTRLYDSLIRQMIRRENRKEKLAEPIDMRNWKKSLLVESTGKLAYLGCSNDNADAEPHDDGSDDRRHSSILWHNYIFYTIEFSHGTLGKYRVTNDSFICGFLLHKFDFAKDLLKAEFPHRSIQEFFAALHCYQLMLSGCQDELGDIRKLILSRDSQLVRFLFGICSQEGKFVQMTNWLSPSLGDSEDIGWSLANEINQFGTNLRDCSPVDNIIMGQRLKLSAERLEEKITNDMHIASHLLKKAVHLRNLSAEFKDSLHIVDLTRDTSGVTDDWCVADNRQSAQLAVVSSRLSKLLEEKFDRINILIWTPSVLRKSGVKWKTLFSQIRSLPSVRVFIISTSGISLPSEFTSVFVRIGYNRTTSSALTNFEFQYVREQRKELLEAVPEENLAKLTENKSEMKIDRLGRSVTDKNVTVNSCESQAALIYSLISLSLLLA